MNAKGKWTLLIIWLVVATGLGVALEAMGVEIPENVRGIGSVMRSAINLILLVLIILLTIKGKGNLKGD